MNDVFIKGDFDPKGIHCSPGALKETERLEKVFDEKVQKEKDKKANHFQLSYVNIRSLHCHQKDAAIDDVLINSDLFLAFLKRSTI